MALADQTLYCRDCNQEFVFTVGEQEFYASRGLTNSPSRCPSCRAARKGQGGGYGGGRGQGGGGMSRGEGGGGQQGGGARRQQAPSNGFEDMDDDIPF